MEPRTLTVSDLMALVAGFAIAFALPPVFNLGGVHFFASLPIWFLVSLVVAECIVRLSIATACVVVLRRFQYGGMPRPAEWLAILLALWAFGEVVPNVDEVVNRIYRATGRSDDFGLWRWRIAGVAGAISAAALVVLAAAWNRLRPWARTLLLSAIGLVLLWGPLPVLSMQFDTLFPALTGLGNGWVFWLALEALRGIGRLPSALLFGLPAVAAYFAWRRGGWRVWIWTEWVGAGAAGGLGSAWLLFYYCGGYEWPPTGWISERIVTGVGLFLSCLVSAWLVRRWGIASESTAISTGVLRVDTVRTR